MNGFPVTKKDQLNMIIEILGTPKETDLAFITDDKALEYLKSYPPATKVSWQQGIWLAMKPWWLEGRI